MDQFTTYNVSKYRFGKREQKNKRIYYQETSSKKILERYLKDMRFLIRKLIKCPVKELEGKKKKKIHGKAQGYES